MKRAHVVPLSKQALAVLQELDSCNKGGSQFVFPNHVTVGKCMSKNTILYALYRMGYHHRATGHGFRATASTILNEMGFRSDLIELQLAHVEKNGVRAAYNHSQLLPERHRMMQI